MAASFGAVAELEAFLLFPGGVEIRIPLRFLQPFGPTALGGFFLPPHPPARNGLVTKYNKGKGQAD